MYLNILEDLQQNFAFTSEQTIPTGDIILSLVAAIVVAIIINFVYKKTYTGVSYTKEFALSIILLTMITSIVIRTITSNLSLSLGMVGALSIVRFRTAVKNPIETIFMFWSIAGGIMAGTGLYVVAILATCIIGLAYFISFAYQSKKTNKLLLVIKTHNMNCDFIFETMKKNSKVQLKTESYKNDIAELTFELSNRDQAEEILKAKESPGILSINLIDIE